MELLPSNFDELGSVELTTLSESLTSRKSELPLQNYRLAQRAIDARLSDVVETERAQRRAEDPDKYDSLHQGVGNRR